MEATNQTEEYLTLTQVSNEDLAGAWTDSSGAKYSQDRKRLLSVPRLESYEVADGTEIICDYAFNKHIKSNIDKHTDDLDFIFNGKLKSVKLPSSIIAIGNGAFDHCDSLKKLNLPDNVKYIGEYAFSCCLNLQQINIPSGITDIKSNTFDGCDRLMEIDLPEGLKSIGGCSFAGCDKLCKIKLPNSLVSIGELAFAFCSSLQSIDIPSNVKEIGDNTFLYCTALNQIFFPDSIKKEVRKALLKRRPKLEYLESKEAYERMKSTIFDKLFLK